MSFVATKTNTMCPRQRGALYPGPVTYNTKENKLT